MQNPFAQAGKLFSSTVLLFLLVLICGCNRRHGPLLHGDRWDPAENILSSTHSHNDYQHYPVNGTRFGFSSLEIDVHLKDGVLYVAHDEEDIRQDHTLKAMYFNRLITSLKIKKYDRWIYAEKEPLILLIDIKSDSVETYEAILKELEPVRKYLTSFSTHKIDYKALMIIISGNRPKKRMLQDSLRYAAYDGRLSDLDKSFPPNFLYWISDNWEEQFKWRGYGPLSRSEKRKLDSFADLVEQKGAQLRFWKTPDRNKLMRERTWELLLSAGVDIIGTDHIEHLHDYLREQQR